jgi:hypothetical protein
MPPKAKAAPAGISSGRDPICIRITLRMETGFLVLVIPVPGRDPGIDPGIAPTGGVRGDPRITSGDDDEWMGVRPKGSQMALLS